jgi:hypothetical protein
MEINNQYSINDIIARLEEESEMKLWEGIYISGDTDVHPYVTNFISDMIGSLNTKRAIEIATHHGVLARYWGINNPDTEIVAVGPDNENIRANLGELTNVKHLESLERSKIESTMVIVNYGLSMPLEDDVSAAINSLYTKGGRIILLNHKKAGFEEEINGWLMSSSRLRKIWSKMDALVVNYEVN